MVAMAKTTTVTITDDIDGTSNAAAYEFTYDGVTYRIDLAKKNKTALDKALKPYLEAATKVSGRRRSTRSRRPASRQTQDLAAIRDWASKNGYEVSGRGRIAQSVVDAYNAAN